jgi:predicted nucleic acid-binding protein
VRVFLDSSALAKRYVEETGSDDVAGILGRASALGLCVICVPEIVSALNRRRREGTVTDADYLLAREQLLTDVADATMLELTPAVVGMSIGLLESSALRAMDALHVACAVDWAADWFVSADHRQIAAAAHAGLAVAHVGP